MSKFQSAIDRYFGITKSGSTISTEIIAGVTTFLAMAYIITVNPGFLVVAGGTGMINSLYIATILGAVIGTLLMAFLAKLPFAQASGMGLNAMVAFTICSPIVMGGYGLDFGQAMILIMLSGLLFLGLTIFGVREKIFDAIPKAVRIAIPVGIGLFIAFIGLQNSGLIITSASVMPNPSSPLDFIINPGTLVTMVGFSSWTAAKAPLVCLIGFLTIAILTKFRVKGAILIGILFATVVGIPMGVTNLDVLEGASWYPRFDQYFSSDPTVGVFAAIFGNFGKDFTGLFSTIGRAVSSIILILTFCMIDMFDTFGTLLGTAKKANMLDENGNVPRFKRALLSDSIATFAGAALGTSTVTTFIESAAGVSVGGRTGFTAFVVAMLFLVSLFLTPIFQLIPSAASASALIFVGVLMMTTIKDIDFHDITVAVPAFLTLFIMPLGYSITNGIGMGIISYCVLELVIYVINIIIYAAKKNKTKNAPTQSVSDIQASEEGAAVATDGQTAVLEKPKWKIHVITAIVAALYLVMYIVPVVY